MPAYIGSNRRFAINNATKAISHSSRSREWLQHERGLIDPHPRVKPYRVLRSFVVRVFFYLRRR